MIWKRTYTKGNDFVLALADEDLMGKHFEEGDLVLDITTFYKGNLVESESLSDVIEKATIINAVGLRSTKILVDKGIITQEQIKKIAGISHIQFIKLSI